MVDVVSPYTFFAFHVLETYRHVWKNVEIEYVPVILGIVMKDSGNRPPIMVKNKAKWLDVDVKRTSAELGLGKFERPPGFPYNSFPAQRALLALKQSENELDFTNCARALWRAGWTEHKDMSKPETWIEAFATVIPRSRAEEHVKRANDKDIKEKIIADTKQILEDGSFGLYVVFLPPSREQIADSL